MAFTFDKAFRDTMKQIVSPRKAKVTNGCIYKKENDYFWYIAVKPYSKTKRRVSVCIKPWHYDELLFSISNPGEELHFTDKLRWNGFNAMTSFILDYSHYPENFSSQTEVNSNDFELWCRELFDTSIKKLDDFIAMVEKDYGGLEEYHIANRENDLLNAAFASVSLERYDEAEKFLNEAKIQNLLFNRSYGSVRHDLRDVLLDYCHAKQTGADWTRNMVLGGK